jgi:hypothetical protein
MVSNIPPGVLTYDASKQQLVIHAKGGIRVENPDTYKPLFEVGLDTDTYYPASGSPRTIETNSMKLFDPTLGHYHFKVVTSPKINSIQLTNPALDKDINIVAEPGISALQMRQDQKTRFLIEDSAGSFPTLRIIGSQGKNIVYLGTNDKTTGGYVSIANHAGEELAAMSPSWKTPNDAGMVRAVNAQGTGTALFGEQPGVVTTLVK